MGLSSPLLNIMSDSEIESSGATGSATFPMQCSALRKGGHVMIKGRPMKIVDMSTSKTGKHGHAKVNMVGIDIFTGKKAEDMSPSTHNMEVPVVTRKEYQLVDMDEDGFMSLMDPNNGDTKDDVQIGDNPSEVEKAIQKAWENDDGDKDIMVTIMSACGEEKASSTKLSG